MNLTRFGFFGALLAAIAARAQEMIVITPCRPKIAWGQQTPLCNGQCPNPECDYTAPPWGLGAVPAVTAAGPKPSQPLAFYTNPLDMSASLVRIVRCPKCNTAYWQDPQKEG